MSKTVLVDTGFWIALFDPRDQHHQEAGAKEDYLERLALVLPWPTVYETVRTRLVRRPDWVLSLDRRLKKPNVELIDDREYREDAYLYAVQYSTRRRRPISMVDMLCRLVIEDPCVRVDYVLTTNAPDFADVCRSCGVELL